MRGRGEEVHGAAGRVREGLDPVLELREGVAVEVLSRGPTWTQVRVSGRSGPSSREQQLEAEVTELTQALGEAAVEIRVWKKSAEGRLGPSRTLR